MSAMETKLAIEPIRIVVIIFSFKYLSTNSYIFVFFLFELTTLIKSLRMIFTTIKSDYQS